MAASETARLIASLELKDLFTKQVDNATKSLGKLDKGLDGSQSRAYKAGAQIGTGIKRGTAIAVGAIGFLATNVALGVHSLEGLEQATTQTNAVLKSTKGIAGETSDSIREMATRFEGLNATIDDTVIQSGANLLLTFTNIRKNAFEPAVLAALNLSTALHQDLQQSALQVGKALNDPIKGITALRRAGVSFTADQIKQIKALVKTNDLYGAQKIILGELDREFKGSFAAQGQTTAGKFEKVRDAVDDLQRSLATALLPALGKISDSLSKFLTSPEVTRGIANLGKDIAGLFSDQNLAAGADFLKSAISTAMTAAPVIEAAAKATLGFVQAAVGIFKQLPAPLQGLLVGGFALNKLTGGLVTNVAGGILGAVKGARGQSPAIPLYVSDVSGGLGGSAAGKTGGLLRGLGTLITKLGGLALIGGGAFGIGAGVGIGGPAGAGVATGGGAALIGGGALLAGPLGAIAGSIAAVALTIKDIRDQSSAQGQGISTSVQNEITGGASLADLKKSLAAVDTGINDIQANPLNVLLAGDALDALHKQHDDLTLAIAGIQKTATNTSTANAILDRGGRELGKASGKTRDDLLPLADLLKGISARFIGALATLQHSSDPKAVAAAVKDLQEVMVKNGHGSVAQTKETIAALTAQLKKTHDPTLQAALKTAITDLKNKVPGREYAQRQIARADQILHSSESVGAKIKGLQTIENDLKNHALPGQTRALQQKIDALRASQAHAIGQTTQAIKDKDLSLKLNVYNPVRVNINARQVAATNAIFSKYFGGTPTGTRAPRGG